MANINMNAQTSETQCSRILAWMQGGHAIDQMEALHRFGCFRLASRISDLREMGYDIKREMVRSEATGKRYASYKIE